MRRSRLTRAQPRVFVLVLLALVGAWSLVSLGWQTSERTWILSGPAVLLGALFAYWLWEYEISRSRPRPTFWRSSMWPAAILLPAVLIAGSPASVRMIYSAAVEGLVCAIVALSVRARWTRRRVTEEP